MKPSTMWLLAGAYGLWVPMVWADGADLWMAANHASPTVAPVYMGQLSPFPHVVVETKPVSSSEEIERMQKWETAQQSADRLLASKEGYAPDLRNMQIDGRVDGAAGPRVFIAGGWVGVGQNLMVKKQVSQAAFRALSDLASFDKNIADAMKKKFYDRLSSSPYVEAKLTQIGKDSIQIQSVYGLTKVPLGGGSGDDD